ncbi:MAG: enolase [Chloroflexi bacterium]|nr:enolase [Chloroflexota bacterium]
MSEIASLSAIEILDSRGKPTLLARCDLADGSLGAASLPSGASTGAAEAHELRDGGDRYAGQGCLRAVANINSEINKALAGRRFERQAQLDKALIELDGSLNKSRLGSNAILGVSLAFCRAQSAQAGLPLYRHLARMADLAPRLPRPMINLFSGGAHAGGQVAIQDVQLVLPKAQSIRHTLEVASDVFRAAAKLIRSRYGMRLLTADEGGLAPPCESSEALLSAAVDAILAAGYKMGDEVALTLDVAATQFYEDDCYQLDAEELSREAMIARLENWCRDYPIVSLEDGLQQDDWTGWRKLLQRLGGRVKILGDDLLCTNTGRIQRAISENAADSLLLKVNQIGTLTEALAALKLARQAGWQVVISARSGETEDDWLADLAAGWAADYIKVGSITQSERLAKYNRLLVLEQMDGLRLEQR